MDAGFLYLERGHAPLHIGCVAILETPIAIEELLRRVDARVDAHRGGMRRYAQRAVPVPLALGHPTWEADPDFDPRCHVYRWSLAGPADMHELTQAVGRLAVQPLDRQKPLWEMHVFENLEGGRMAVYQKVHHCMIDGMAGAQLLEALLDPSPDVEDRPDPHAAARPLPGPSRRMGRALAENVWRQAGAALSMARRPMAARAALDRMRQMAWSALRLATSDVPKLPWNAPIGRRRQLAFTALSLDAVREIRAVRGGTINDVVLCILAGGLHRYLRAIGIETRGLEAVALVPVSLRSAGEGDAMGNRISAMLVPLAVDPPQEVPRLVATRAITDRLKSDSAWVGIDALLQALDGLPAPLVALAGGQIKLGGRDGLAPIANLVATNVAGPRETRYLCGARVDALYPLVPIVDGVGLGVAVFSYAGTLHVGLSADPGGVPDLEKLRVSIEEAFSDLAASV